MAYSILQYTRVHVLQFCNTRVYPGTGSAKWNWRASCSVNVQGLHHGLHQCEAPKLGAGIVVNGNNVPCPPCAQFIEEHHLLYSSTLCVRTQCTDTHTQLQLSEVLHAADDIHPRAYIVLLLCPMGIKYFPPKQVLKYNLSDNIMILQYFHS